MKRLSKNFLLIIKILNHILTMKKIIFSKTLTLFLAIISAATISTTFVSCFKDSCNGEETFVRWTPIYKTDAELRQNPTFEAAQPLKRPGKIWFYQNYMLINEQREGIHVIDNADPAAPRNIGFLKIHGNVDMAVKGSTLYADNGPHLVVLDVANIAQPRFLMRRDTAFQQRYPFVQGRGFLIDYFAEQVTLPITDCNDPKYSGYWQDNGVWFERAFSADVRAMNPAIQNLASSSSIPSVTSVGGSMARFCTIGNYLYAVDTWRMLVFDISRPQTPVRGSTIQVGWGIETIFPMNDKIFIGSNSGMFIYDAVNPAQPRFLSQFTHARACDPVVVEGDVAYVTLRSGNTCDGFNNQLDVLNISNLAQPVLIKTYPMKNPRGLSVWDKSLYLCDDGFKIFDATDNLQIDKNQKSQIAGFDTYDVIALSYGARKIAMVIGADGFYQFDVTDATRPQQLSKIGVVR